MAELRARTQTELEFRLRALPASLAGWKKLAEGNVDGFGIHRNQLRAVDAMITSLAARRDALLASLAGKDPAGYANGYLEVLEEIAAVDGVWQVFELALHQRQDPVRKPLLDLADLVAASCYREVIERAVTWGLVPGDDRRAPPLVVLEAAVTPSTVKRGEALALVGHPLPEVRDFRLPIPLVLVPPDHVDAAWLLCALYHEIGHNLDQDLRLQRKLQDELLALAPGTISQERAEQWSAWTPEIVADALGVLLGGPGYASAVAGALTVMAPATLFATLDRSDRHPSPHVRVPLLCALLDRLGVDEWKVHSARLRADGQAHPPPDWAAPYLGDLDHVVTVVLETQLAPPAPHRVRDLIDGLDVARLGRIQAHLEANQPRGDMTVVRFRDVPAAAQLAALGEPVGGLEGLQARALDFAGRIARPKFLAAWPGKDADYVRMTQALVLGPERHP